MQTQDAPLSIKNCPLISSSKSSPSDPSHWITSIYTMRELQLPASIHYQTNVLKMFFFNSLIS